MRRSRFLGFLAAKVEVTDVRFTLVGVEHLIGASDTETNDNASRKLLIGHIRHVFTKVLAGAGMKVQGK
jgi:hypothetical protein